MKTTVVNEGNARFSDLRDCLLREADRYLLLAASNFARAVDGLRASSSYWTLVGLYYASFFAARSVMAMHGCWIGKPGWIEATSSNPGSQRLSFRTGRYDRGGSHKVSWQAYYRAVNPLRQFVDPQCILAIDPINSSPSWMIDLRNDVNYEPQSALSLINDFETAFNAKHIPGCFPGKFNTAFQASEAFIKLARDTATNLNLSTDVFGNFASRASGIQALVVDPADPSLAAFAATKYGDIVF